MSRRQTEELHRVISPAYPVHCHIRNSWLLFKKWRNCPFQKFTLQNSRKQPECNSHFLTQQDILWQLLKRYSLTPVTHLDGHSISLWDKHTRSLRKRIYVFMKNTPPSQWYLGNICTKVSLKWFYLYQPLLCLEGTETGISTSRPPCFQGVPKSKGTNLGITTLWQLLKHEPNATPLGAVVYSSKLLSFYLYFTILELETFIYGHFLQKWVKPNWIRHSVVLLGSCREACTH